MPFTSEYFDDLRTLGRWIYDHDLKPNADVRLHTHNPKNKFIDISFKNFNDAVEFSLTFADILY